MNANFINPAATGLWRAIAPDCLPVFPKAGQPDGLTFCHCGPDNCGSGQEGTT